jgi:hypothetical protein
MESTYTNTKANEMNTTAHVLSKLADGRTRTIDEIWHGIEPDSRYTVAFALRDLIAAGTVEMRETRRMSRGATSWDTETGYRLS